MTSTIIDMLASILNYIVQLVFYQLLFGRFNIYLLKQILQVDALEPETQSRVIMGNLLTKIFIDIITYTPWKKVFPFIDKVIRVILYIFIMFSSVSTSIILITMANGVINVLVVGFLVGYDQIIGDEFQATIYRATLIATTVMWGKDIVVACHHEFFPILSNTCLK